MSTQPPPGRYRVVEKGRRLVVIDTLTGKEAARVPPPPPAMVARAIGDLPAVSAPGSVDRIVFEGGMRLRTSRLYDLKGPRTVVIDAAGMKRVSDARGWIIATGVVFLGVAFAFPILFVPLAIALFNPKIRNRPRQLITDWLDRYVSGG